MRCDFNDSFEGDTADAPIALKKLFQKQLVLLFLFLFTSSNCTREKPCNNMKESLLTLLSICFEILMQI